MKRLIFPAVLALALTGSLAFAQQPAATPDATQPPAPVQREHASNPNHEAKRLAKALSLTSDQVSKIEPILADRDQKLEALKTNTTLAPKDMHKQMRAIHESTEQQLSTILTPDQLQQMKAMRHAHEHEGAPNQTQPLTPPPAA